MTKHTQQESSRFYTYPDFRCVIVQTGASYTRIARAYFSLRRVCQARYYDYLKSFSGILTVIRNPLFKKFDKNGEKNFSTAVQGT